MSRSVAWRPKCTADVVTALDQLLPRTTLLVVQERGPTSFVLKQISQPTTSSSSSGTYDTINGSNSNGTTSEDKPAPAKLFKVSVGSINTCSCSVGSRCLPSGGPLPPAAPALAAAGAARALAVTEATTLVRSHMSSERGAAGVGSGAAAGGASGEVSRRALGPSDPPPPPSVTAAAAAVEGDMCQHIVFVLARVFRLPRTNPLLWQKSLLASEIDQMLKARSTKHLQQQAVLSSNHNQPGADQSIIGGAGGSGPDAARTLEQLMRPNERPFDPTDDDDCCPICCDGLVQGPPPSSSDSGGGTWTPAELAAYAREKLVYCKSGCGKHVHARCFGELARHHEHQQHQKPQSSSSSAAALRCPMCRCLWGPVELPDPVAIAKAAKQQQCADQQQLALLQQHSVACSTCGKAVGPADRLFRCAFCTERCIHLCGPCYHGTIGGPVAHREHPFDVSLAARAFGNIPTLLRRQWEPAEDRQPVTAAVTTDVLGDTSTAMHDSNSSGFTEALRILAEAGDGGGGGDMDSARLAAALAAAIRGDDGPPDGEGHGGDRSEGQAAAAAPRLPSAEAVKAVLVPVQFEPEACAYDTCAICADPFEPGDGGVNASPSIVTTLPGGCGHVFHYLCALRWLTEYSATCPIDGLPIAALQTLAEGGGGGPPRRRNRPPPAAHSGSKMSPHPQRGGARGPAAPAAARQRSAAPSSAPLFVLEGHGLALAAGNGAGGSSGTGGECGAAVAGRGQAESARRPPHPQRQPQSSAPLRTPVAQRPGVITGSARVTTTTTTARGHSVGGGRGGGRGAEAVVRRRPGDDSAGSRRGAGGAAERRSSQPQALPPLFEFIHVTSASSHR